MKLSAVMLFHPQLNGGADLKPGTHCSRRNASLNLRVAIVHIYNCVLDFNVLAIPVH